MSWNNRDEYETAAANRIGRGIRAIQGGVDPNKNGDHTPIQVPRLGT
jgi:hypothetical protein